MVKIFIDPGHGGTDPGAVGNGLKEKDVTLKIAKKVKAMLQDYEGIQAKMSREGDQTVSLSQRVKMANDWNADYFISIHINAGGGFGFESFIWNGQYSSKVDTDKKRNALHDAIIKATSFNNRGKKQANFQVIRETLMPAVLTENGFIDNVTDANNLKSDPFLTKIAQGHVDGLVTIFKLKKKSKQKPSTKPNKGKLFKVQVGAFAVKENAERLAADLQSKGYPVYIVEE